MSSTIEATEPEVLLTRSEVARMLGVAPTTVTRWARENRIPCRLTLGGHHRFERTVVESIRADMERGVVLEGPRFGRAK